MFLNKRKPMSKHLEKALRHRHHFVAFLDFFYSHLKYFMEIPPHTIVITTIRITGKRTVSTGSPNDVAFSNLIPCVSGKIAEKFCSASGIIAYGKVAPEKINIGKYKTLATMLAILAFGAMPPTIVPILNMDTITRINAAKNNSTEPFILKSKNKKATIKVRISDATAYSVKTVNCTSKISVGLIGVTLNLFNIFLLR